MQELPNEFGGLKNLKVLYLDNNNLQKIPREFRRLTKLRQLWLSANNLQEIPIEISRLKRLSYLEFNGDKMVIIFCINRENVSKCILKNIYQPILELL